MSDLAGGGYVGGNFRGTVDFQELPAVGVTSLTSFKAAIGASDTDAYVIRMGPAGNVLWAMRAGGFDRDRVSALASDAHGAFAVGGFGETSNVGPYGTACRNTPWCPQGASTWGDGATPEADSHGVHAGEPSSADFGGFTFVQSRGYGNAYAMRLSPLGSVQWAVHIRTNVCAFCHSHATDVAADGVGGAYVAGHWQGTATFGSTILESGGNGQLVAC